MIIPDRTLDRRIADGALLKINEADGIARRLRVVGMARRVFGDDALADEWLRAANPALDGNIPIRMARTDAKASDNAGHDVNLAGLRSYLAGDQVFGPVTLIALRMRATNNLSLQASRNITRGSFSIDYLLPTPETADAIEVSYFDAATWQQQRVTARLAGSTAERPSKLALFGVTERAHGLREGLYHAAANRYRRRVVRFGTEMEGFIPSIGDLVAIQHDMPGWGAHAEASGWHAASLQLTLDEPMTFGPGNHYVGLRRRGGSLSGPWLVTAGPRPEVLILAEAPDMTPQTGAEEERSHVVFGPATSWRVLARVAQVRPRGLYQAEIEAVVEDPAVHTADQGVTAAPIRLSSLPRQITRPVVAGLVARRLPDDPTRVVLSWQPAPGADSYQIEMAEGADPAVPDISWTRAADTTAAHYVLTLLYATQTLIRLRGAGLAAGPWIAASIGDLVGDYWSLDSATFWTTDPAIFWSS